jgi:hypothetical protein
MRGGVFMQRQPHQRDAVGGYALRDGAIHQLELLLVQSQFDDGLSHERLPLAAIGTAKSCIQDLS